MRSDRDDGQTNISIVGPQMKVVGDLITEGTVRVEGRVDGNVEAAKAVVVGKGGEIHGDVRTQDCVVSGRITGSLIAGSRLEVQSTAQVDGEVHARRLQLEEGALLNGTVKMGEVEVVTSGGGTGKRAADAGLPTLEPAASSSTQDGEERNE